MKLNNIQIKFLLLIMIVVMTIFNINNSYGQFQYDADGPMWNPQNSGTNAILRDIHFFNTDTGITVGSNGTYLKTTNGGITWNSQSIGVTHDLWAVKFRNNTGYICGAAGTVLRTTNGGNNWVDVSPGVQGYLYDLVFFNANTCMVVGDAGYLARTTNGGTNWTVIPTGLTVQSIQAIDFIDANTGFAVGFAGNMIKTTNGGLNWSFISTGTTNLLYDITFLGNTGYFTGVSGVLKKSTNGGNNWTTLNSGTTSILIDLEFIDENTGFVCGQSSLIKKTTDGGVTWQTQSTQGSTYLYNFWLDSPNSGYTVGIGGTILRSVGIPLPGTPSNLSYSVLDTGVVELNWDDSSSSEDGFVIQRKDNIDTNWTSIDTVSANNTDYTDSGLDIGKTYFWRVYARNAAGNSPYSNEVSTLITNTGIITAIIPEKFELYQNYPNPFNPSTKINFDVPKEGNVKLTVFDVIGREVAVLVNGIKQPGSYSLEWYAENLNSGIYFYSLEFGIHKSVKRMILLK